MPDDPHWDGNHISTIDTAPQRLARRTAADALRRLTPLIAWGLVPQEQLTATAEALETLVDGLQHFSRSSRYDGTNGIRLDGGSRAEAANNSLWESHCVLGVSHPSAPPVAIERTHDHIVGRVRWTATYEGQRGFVHGGALASAFDVVLGHAAARLGIPVVTGTMTLRFVTSVPIENEATLCASLVDVERRKVG